MRQLVLGAILAAMIPLSAQAQEAGDPAAGEKAFAPCKACHNFQKNGVGPDLKGVVGRKAGTYEGYNYSAALRNRASPGTRRICTRGYVIAYLKSQS